ncbi:MAG: ATPase [Alphaproteobacteria bacterium]|nr:ATPase [Alphaproteobacteria bacterium]
MIRFMLALAAILFTATAHAEVTASAPNGFVSRHVVTVPMAPAAAYERFVRVQDWWDGADTYSRSAANLKLEARPGGAWIETLPAGGFVEHMRVLFVSPGKTLRLEGGLGPLQDMPVRSVMAVTFETDGSGTKVTMTYSVGGYFANGTAQIAPGVDFVLGAGLARYAQPPAPSR